MVTEYGSASTEIIPSPASVELVEHAVKPVSFVVILLSVGAVHVVVMESVHMLAEAGDGATGNANMPRAATVAAEANVM